MRFIKTVLFLFILLNGTLQAQTIERLYSDPRYDYISMDIASLPSGAQFVYSAVKHIDSTEYRRVNITLLDTKGDFKDKSWDLLLDSLGVKAITLPEGNIQIISQNELLMTITDAKNNRHVTIKTDFNGQILNVKSIDRPTGNNKDRNRLQYFDYDSLLVQYGAVNSTVNPYIYLNHYNDKGENTYAKTYKIPGDKLVQIGGINRTFHDSAYVFCGMKGDIKSDFFITKMTNNYDIEWSYRYALLGGGGTNGNAVDIIQLNYNIYIATFNDYDAAGKQNGYISRLDSAGAVVWVKRLQYPVADTDCQLTGLVRLTNDQVAVSLQKKKPNNKSTIVMIGFDIEGNKLWEEQYKETYDRTANGFPNFSDKLIKTSKERLLYLTTGFDKNDIIQSPSLYLISARTDGSTDCNAVVNDIKIDSVAMFADTLIWTVNDDISSSKVEAWKRPRTVIPYTIKIANGKQKYCPNEEVETHLIGTIKGAISYKWNKENNTTDSLKIGKDKARILSAEQYIIEVEVRDKYCYSLCDTFKIDTIISPTVLLEVIDNYCTNKTFEIVLVTANQFDASSIKWSNGETGTPSITVDKTGTYSVSVTNECNDELTAKQYVLAAEILDKEVTLNLDNSSYCDSFKVKATLVNFGDFSSAKWSNGSTEPTTWISSGSQSITVTNICNEKKNVSFDALADEDCPKPLQWPNAFTPTETEEGFEANKTFGPFNKTHAPVSNYNLLIVNRWGNIVFESDDINKRWNGLAKDKKAIGGTYFFKASYKTDIGEYEEKGPVVLVR